jgi:hypothetical protein
MAATKKTSESTGSRSSGTSIASVAGIQQKPASSDKSTPAAKSISTAKSSMEKFKVEVASELGVNLKNEHNGKLTSREAGSIGGELVRRMIKKQKSQME